MVKASRALLQARKTIDDCMQLLDQKTEQIATADARLMKADQRERDLQLRLAERTEELTELAAKNDADVRRIGELETENAAIGQQLVDQMKEIGESRQKIANLQARITELGKERDSAEANNNFLRDSMHSLTIEKARLEGQLERVREFDPVTDQQERREHLTDIRYPRSYRDVPLSLQGADAGARASWYRRG